MFLPNKPEQEEQGRGGLLGFFDRAIAPNQRTGMSPLTAAAAGLDALILPEMRMGDAIRQQGAQRAKGMAANRTAETLRAQGREDLAKLLLDGGINAQQAISMMQSDKAADLAFKRQKDLAAFTAGLKDPKAPKTYEFQAVVNDLMAANPNMSRSEALSLALNKNKSVTNVQLGADGKPQSTFWKKVDEDFAKDFAQLSSSGLVSAERNAATIQAVLDKMGNTEGMQLSGPGQALLGRMGRALFNPEAENVKGLVGQVVQQSLRETLGGQFAQKEGEALIQRAYDEALTPEMNAARLRALFTQLQSIAQSKRAMFDYAKAKGTLEGYEGPLVGTPTREDFFAVMQSAAPVDQSKFEVSGNYDWSSFTKDQADALSTAEVASMNPADYEAWKKVSGYK
jgi:hypothetical protein